LLKGSTLEVCPDHCSPSRSNQLERFTMFTLIRRLFGQLPPPPPDPRIAELEEEIADLRQKLTEQAGTISEMVAAHSPNPQPAPDPQTADETVTASPPKRARSRKPREG